MQSGSFFDWNFEMLNHRRILLLALIFAVHLAVGCGTEENDVNQFADGDGDHEGGDDEYENGDGDHANGDGDACETNDDCPEEGVYCNRAPGCDELGTCEPIPDWDCGGDLDSYCTCDGQWKSGDTLCIFEPYEFRSNPMNPHGSCEAPWPECETNVDCAADQHCDREPGCGEPGLCQPGSPEICDETETPFCDCNGEDQVSSSSCIPEPYAHLGTCEI